MSLVLVSPPTDLPVTLEELKSHVRLDGADEDALVMGYLRAAVAHLDGRDSFLGRALITQTWDLVLDAFPCGDIEIPLSPLQSVTSISYVDSDGAAQTWAAADYLVSTWRRPGLVTPAYGESYPSTRSQHGAVTVRFVAGYGERNDVPEPIRQALMLMVADMHAHRETILAGSTVVPIPFSAAALLAPYRVFL